MKYLERQDLRDIALGATFLGSGGGGDPECALLLAEHYFDEYGPASLISAEELSCDDLVVPLAFMGAPLVASEKLVSGREFEPLFEGISREFGKSPTVLVPAEIGGSNALTPLWIGARGKIPVLDADMIGRAFPKLEMCSCNLHGLAATPAFLACSQSRSVTAREMEAPDVERFFRAVCEEMGSSALAALYILRGEEARGMLLHGSLSLAATLGVQLRTRSLDVHMLAGGVISDVAQTIEGGFLMGRVQVKNKEATYEVLFQNEYYALFRDGTPLALTPDIIAIVDRKSGRPICVEKLRFGLEVELCSYPVHPIWKSPEGLELVGPKAFGLEVEYDHRH
jgi:hypothetical protein